MITKLSIASPKPDQELIDMLEEVLAKVRAGDIHGVLVLSQDKTGIAYNIAGIKDRFEVLGWLSHAMHKLQSD